MLDAALAAIRSDRPREALVHLLELWRTAPSPELATAVRAVSERVASDPAPLRGRSDEANARWTQLAKQPDITDVPALLATLADVPVAEASRRIALVAPWPADPRVDSGLLELLDRLPFQANTTRPFWRSVFDRLRTTRDPTVRSALEHQLERIPGNTPPTTAQWFSGQLRRLIEDLQPLVRAPAPTGLDDLLRELSAPRHAPRDLAELLAAIHAQPDDDAARLVYADALLEHGDPRGELIIIQCKLANGLAEPVLRLREQALLREHGERWLGALSPIVVAPYAFERGFLAMCTLDGRKLEHIRRLAGDPVWATIRRVAFRLTQPVDVAKTIAVLRALPTTVRQIEVTAHGLEPAGLTRIRDAADQLTHLEFCNVTS